MVDRSLIEQRRQLALNHFAPLWRPTREFGVNDAERDAYYAVAADHIGRTEPIRYIEFGVASGASMRRMTGLFSNPASEFFGFDSFEGLPEDWAHLRRGAFNMAGRLPVFEDRRVNLVKGYIQNTLPPFLAVERPRMTTIIHYDADLYSVTLFALAMLHAQLEHYYFLFDEFHIGVGDALDECTALQDFASAFPVKLEFYARTAGVLRVFGKMSKVEFVVSQA